MKTSVFWHAFATFLLRFRIPILVVITVMTGFMWMNRGQKYVQDFAKIIPATDPEFLQYMEFKKTYGEDGNVIAIGIEGDIFNLEFYNALYDLTDSLKSIKGAESVISITHLVNLELDTVAEKFQLTRLAPTKPTTQAELDTIRMRLEALPFYHQLIFNKEKQSTLLALAYDRSTLDTEDKQRGYDDMLHFTEPFAKRFNTEVRYAGFPVLRVHAHRTIGKEVQLFLGLAVLVCALTVFLFFRSWITTLFTLLIVGIIIVWSMGVIGLFDFRINLMLAMVPALITVIAIPNCVYLITKYHILYRATGDKKASLIGVIEKLGVAAVLTNATTAAGLGTNLFTDIVMLKQFGIIGSLSVGIAFLLSVVLVPVVFSFLPTPKPSETAHLDRKGLNAILDFLTRTVKYHRKWVFIGAGLVFVLSLIGMSLVVAKSYVADDLPRGSKIFTDLQFMEDRFGGVLPIEILVDTKRKMGLAKIQNLRKIEELQDSLATYPALSRSMSLVDMVKFSRQTLVYGGPEEYQLPSKSEFDFIKIYLKNTKLNVGGLNKTLVDTAFQKARITANIRDVGSDQLGLVLDSIRTDIAAIFPAEDYDVKVTGTTSIIVKGNKYLIDNLVQSIALAFVIIALLMGMLFRSPKMILLSVIPNLLPLLMVAGVMGYLGIPLKPSTAIVFGTAFGIAVDTAIHFLTRYRIGLKLGESTEQAIYETYQDTGVGMMYTSVILFLGFIIFTTSQYGGTQALGLLTALTLIIAMLSNLLLLPALLMRFDNRPGGITPPAQAN